ncbi:MAG: hypothetical protein HN488_00125 [Saprospiraceae bacterium]|nr:hypothetical protein [Saprospiraceae bacterium]
MNKLRLTKSIPHGNVMVISSIAGLGEIFQSDPTNSTSSISTESPI